jgi:alpha-tubulin suppressor-like RCC1 family protein
LTNWASIASGASGTPANAFTLAVKTDGTAWSWGYGVNGQLGLGNITSYSSPKQVGALTNWLLVSCGKYSAVSIKADGTLWSWGKNSLYALGLGNTTNYSSPKQIGSETGWLKATGGEYPGLAIQQ